MSGVRSRADKDNAACQRTDARSSHSDANRDGTAGRDAAPIWPSVWAASRRTLSAGSCNAPSRACTAVAAAEPRRPSAQAAQRRTSGLASDKAVASPAKSASAWGRQTGDGSRSTPDSARVAATSRDPWALRWS